MIQDHCRTRPGSRHRVTRAGRRDLLIYPALITLGANVLAACTGQWPYSPPPPSAVRSLASVLPSASARPARKPKPPQATDVPVPDAGGEMLARTEPAPAMPAPGSTFAFTPSSPAAPSPADARATNSSLPQASELIGLDQPGATRLLGAAAEQFEQPPAAVWRYKNATCELDLFFYLDLRSNQMRTLHYALKGDGGNPARRQDCLGSLRAARSN
jgi:hypothetical protein